MAISAYINTSANSWVNSDANVWDDATIIEHHRLQLTQVYDLVNRFHRLLFNQPYYLSGPLRTRLKQLYSSRLIARLFQRYNDNPRLIIQFRQWYWESKEHRILLRQKWDDYLNFRISFRQIYHLFRSLEKDSNQLYSITGIEVQKDLNQHFNIESNNLLLKELNQLYLLLGDSSATDINMPEVLLNSSEIVVESINFEGNLDTYCITSTLGFKDYSLYKKCKLEDIVQITVGSDVLVQFVESKQRARQVRNPVQYYINCISLSAKLDVPYALAIDGDLGPNWASDIADTLVSSLGLTLEWDIIDQYYDADVFFGNGDTPLTILKRLANPTKGRVQTLLDGTVRVIPNYTVSPTEWKTTTPDVYLTDAKDFFNTGEQPDIREGYNKFLISNTLTPSAFDKLEEEEISATRKYIRAYQVPWQDGTDIPFYTSGGSHVQIFTNDNWLSGIEETITEQIEIIQGVGNVQYPIYSINSFEYLETHLGALTHSEDGTINTDIGNQSLLSITYITKYRQWEVVDDRVEDVQFILGEEE